MTSTRPFESWPSTVPAWLQRPPPSTRGRPVARSGRSRPWYRAVNRRPLGSQSSTRIASLPWYSSDQYQPSYLMHCWSKLSSPHLLRNRARAARPTSYELRDILNHAFHDAPRDGSYLRTSAGRKSSKFHRGCGWATSDLIDDQPGRNDSIVWRVGDC